MKHINKSAEPQSLTTFKRLNPVEWKSIHEAPNKHVYEDCLTQCVVDQNNLCGYTEMCLDQGFAHIDHYIKRDIDSRLTFCWENMIAAVKDYRYGADWKDNHISHADYDPTNKIYRTILNPIVDSFLDRFQYATDGSIEPFNERDEKAKDTILMFNLNEISLKERRRDAMESARLMVAGGMTRQDVLESLAPSGFVSAVEYELRHANVNNVL